MNEDDLLHRLYEAANDTHYIDHQTAREAAARIRELEAHTATYRAQVDAVLKDRALIIAERDRTFALMLARAETAEADARSWRTVALSNQAASQSHQERWAKAESERDRMRDALIDILDTGGAFGTAARPVRIDLIARAALTAPSAKPKE